MRVLAYPILHLIVRCARGDKLFEFIRIQFGFGQELLIHRAVIRVIPLPPDQSGAAFIKAASRQFESRKLLFGRPGLLPPQISCETPDFV